jgi:hypothetical protein
MKTRTVGIIALLLTVATYLWVALMIADSTRHPPVTNPYDAIHYASGQDWLYTLNYANATLITILATLLFAALYTLFKDTAPAAMLAGLVFLPVYTAMNLFVYLSQITIVPEMIILRDTLSVDSNSLDFLIALLVQLWPGSITAMINILAYAVLGIPSLLYGLEMLHRGPLMRAAGILLCMNGIAALLGFVGLTTHSTILMNGVMISGVLFALSLIPLTIALLRGEGVARCS